MFSGKYRAVNADIVAADIAAAADADAALHPLLQRGYDIFRRKVQALKRLHRELDHDGRPAEYSHAVVRAGVQLLQHVWNQTHPVRPALIGVVNAQGAVQILTLQPVLGFIEVESSGLALIRIASAVSISSVKR